MPRSRCATRSPPTIFQEAAQKYFKHAHDSQPTIPQIAAYYRERKMACVIFSVDGLRARGIKPVSNEEVAELAAENSDVMIPFASIDPASGAAGVREARRLIEHYGVKGFKFHPQFQEFFPTIAPPIRCTRSSRSTSCRRCSIRATPEWVPACLVAEVSG